MKTRTHKASTVAFLIGVFALSMILAPSAAVAVTAKELDKANNASWYLLGAGIAIATVGIVMAVTGDKDKDKDKDKAKDQDPALEEKATDDETATEKKSADPVRTKGDHSSGDPSGMILVPEDDSRVGLFFKVTDDRPLLNADKKTLDFSDLTLRAGVTIGF